MKLLVVSLVLIAAVCFGGEYTATTNVELVLPSRELNADNAPLYVAGTTYTNGMYVRQTNSAGDRYYAAVELSGESVAPGPTNVIGRLDDGGMTWQFIPRGPRYGFVVQNKSGYVLKITRNNGADTFLLANDSIWYCDSNPDQGAVFGQLVSATAVTGSVNVYEW